MYSNAFFPIVPPEGAEKGGFAGKYRDFIRKRAAPARRGCFPEPPCALSAKEQPLAICRAAT